MKLSEFKRRLGYYIAHTGSNNTTNLLEDWNGYDDINLDMVNEYNCSLGSVISVLDEIEIDSELDRYGRCGGMYIKVNNVLR